MYIDVLVASLSLSIYPFLYLAITLPTTISLPTKKNKNHKKIKKRCVFCSVLFLHDICHYYNIAFNSK